MNVSGSSQPAPSYFVLATAGHVDHGKSALVKALTGTDPDRLPEEKARGITIDLGFAHLELPGLQNHPGGIHLGIVDVPGHEDFVSNMVAGVGSIDLALLVVAANDGWMPQTEEHLQILTYLGVTQAVVALTKIDLVRMKESSVIASVRERLAGSPIASAPVIPTSVISGKGLPAIKSALGQVLGRMPAPPDAGKPRLAIDRAFTLRGIGAVVTGTLTGGSFERGQLVHLQPSGQATRIRTIQSHLQELASIGPGRRTALSLADVRVAARSDRAGAANTGVRRGQIVTLPEFGPGALTLDVAISRSSRPIEGNASPDQPIKSGARVRIHHGTCNVPARLQFFAAEELRCGESTIAQLRLEAPLFALAGDRFIVRDWAEQTTLAGGIILDPQADRQAFRSARQQSFLRSLLQSQGNAVAALQALLQRDRMADRRSLLARTQFSTPQIEGALAQLEAAGKAAVRGKLVVEADWWTRLKQEAAQAIDAHHQAHPEQPGLPLNELRAVLAAQRTPPEALDALLVDLFTADFVRAGTVAKRATHGPALPPRLQRAGALLRESLLAHALDPPSRKTLASTPLAQEALRFLATTGQAVEIGPDVVLLSEHYARAVALIEAHLAKAPATVSQLRQVIGSSRRVVVPLLEKLDREGVTQRVGDLRRLRQQPPGPPH